MDADEVSPFEALRDHVRRRPDWKIGLYSTRETPSSLTTLVVTVDGDPFGVALGEKGVQALDQAATDVLAAMMRAGVKLG
jgi:hypothetical protein